MTFESWRLAKNLEAKIIIMKRLGTALFAIFLLNVLAVAQKFPDYPTKAASQYSSCQTKDGIRVAIEAVADKDEQKKYFGANLGSQGFLPVFVIVENTLENSSVLLKRDRVTYHLEGKSESDKKVSVNSTSGQVLAIAGAGGALMFVGLKMMADASKVRQNIFMRELRTATVSPGKSFSGFLYVQVGKHGPVKRQLTLTLLLALDDKKEETPFSFSMEVPEN